MSTDKNTEQVSELARETAEAEIQDFMSESFREQGCHVQSALTKLAASKDAEIEALKNEVNDLYHIQCQSYAEDLARHVAALKVVTDALKLTGDYSKSPNS